MARVKAKEKILTGDEMLEQALVPESEQPYTVPDNWVWTRLDNINNYTSASINPKKQAGTIFELYSVPSFDNDYPEIILGSDIGSTKNTVRKNDILLCKINPRINRVWIVSQHTENQAIASSEWIIVRSNNSIIAKYLMWCLTCSFFRKILLANVSGVGGSLMRAQPKYVKDYPVPLAPLAEQQRIVAVIESLFEKLDKARDLIQSVLDSFENRKAAIFHKAFTGELTAKWREENGVRLEDWEETHLKKVVSGFKYGTSDKSDYSYSGMPVIRIPNVISNTVDFLDIKYLSHNNMGVESQVHENDILVIRSNGSRDLVGKCALVPSIEKEYAYASYLIRIRPQKTIEASFLLYFLNSTIARVQLFSKSKSSVGINNINTKELGSIIINLPSLPEQKEIVRILDNLLAFEQKAKDLSNVIEKIDLMKKAILARAFRGELGTNDPNEASAVSLLREVLS